MRGSPGFLGNLETTAILVRVARPDNTESQKLYSSSTKPCHVPSVRLESQNWCGRTNNWWHTAHLYSNDVFAWLPKDTASNTIQIRASLWKGRSGISPSQTSYISTWCSYCITHQTCYYLQVHLNELYTECSETARTCANSGYHTLLSNFCRVLENEANPDFAPWAPDHSSLYPPSPRKRSRILSSLKYLLLTGS